MSTGKNQTTVTAHGSLHLAISERNLEIAQILVHHGAYLGDLFGLDRKSVLHRIIATSSARFKGDIISFIKSLIGRGIDVNFPDADGNTVLHALLSKFEHFTKINYDIAKLICESKMIKANLLNNNGDTVLMIGIKCWQTYFIKFMKGNNNEFSLLHDLVKCSDLNITDINGDTVLHHAFRGFASDIQTNKSLRELHDFVLFLLEHGCERFRKNNMGQTPLHTFIENWPKKRCSYLSIDYYKVEHYRDLLRHCVLKDDTDSGGVTILHRAVLDHYTPHITDILANKHSVSYINAKVPCDISSTGLNSHLLPKIGLTALQIAITQYPDCREIIGILFKSGADVHIEFPESVCHHKKTILEVRWSLYLKTLCATGLGLWV